MTRQQGSQHNSLPTIFHTRGSDCLLVRNQLEYLPLCRSHHSLIFFSRAGQKLQAKAPKNHSKMQPSDGASHKHPWQQIPKRAPGCFLGREGGYTLFLNTVVIKNKQDRWQGRGQGLSLGPQKRFKLRLDASQEWKHFQTDNLRRKSQLNVCSDYRKIPSASAGEDRGFLHRTTFINTSQKAQIEFSKLKTPLT